MSSVIKVLTSLRTTEFYWSPSKTVCGGHKLHFKMFLANNQCCEVFIIQVFEIHIWNILHVFCILVANKMYFVFHIILCNLYLNYNLGQTGFVLCAVSRCKYYIGQNITSVASWSHISGNTDTVLELERSTKNWTGRIQSSLWNTAVDAAVWVCILEWQPCRWMCLLAHCHDAEAHHVQLCLAFVWQLQEVSWLTEHNRHLLQSFLMPSSQLFKLFHYPNTQMP